MNTKQSQPSSCFKNTLIPSVSKVYFAFRAISATRVIENSTDLPAVELIDNFHLS